MEITFAHALPRPLARVERALLDPGFARALADACPALAESRVLDYAVRGDLVERVTWFRAAPEFLGALFARLPAVAWVERVRWSREEHSGRFTVSPEVPAVMARRVRCDGNYTLVSQGDAITTRTVTASLTIRAPLVGGAAEARLAEMLRVIFASEAALLGAAP